MVFNSQAASYCAGLLWVILLLRSQSEEGLGWWEEKREWEKTRFQAMVPIPPLSPQHTHTTVQWGNTEQVTARDQTTLQMGPQWGQCFTAWRSWLHERHLKCSGQKITGNIWCNTTLKPNKEKKRGKKRYKLYSRDSHGQGKQKGDGHY